VTIFFLKKRINDKEAMRVFFTSQAIFALTNASASMSITIFAKGIGKKTSTFF